MSATSNNPLKFNLYILSLALLFVFIIIITIEGLEIKEGQKLSQPWTYLSLKNTVALVSLLALAYSFFAYKYFSFRLSGSPDIPFKINKLTSINYEHLTFLATYVVPLISFDFESGRQMIVLALLLVLMGIIYIKTDLFYANPSLALLGFHVYRADGKFKTGERNDIIIISRGRLTEGEEVAHIKLDNNIFYVRKIRT